MDSYLVYLLIVNVLAFLLFAKFMFPESFFQGLLQIG